MNKRSRCEVFHVKHQTKISQRNRILVLLLILPRLNRQLLGLIFPRLPTPLPRQPQLRRYHVLLITETGVLHLPVMCIPMRPISGDCFFFLQLGLLDVEKFVLE